MKPIISVEGLGKSYTIRHEGQTPYKSLREEIFKLPKRLLSRGAQSQEEFWALKDVNFDIMPGDRVGIIGRNGAGKSTLLKLLSRITEPTTGRITMRGRVASLLEVGTGFHAELTGRENIYLNGAILGMTRAEVRRKFDEIVDFAGVEKFLDTPVKRYSSGMYVRLAFAVAAHLEPEILIVDEVLAVGDAEFQKKCLGKMEEVSKGQGRTVLFVSHNMGAVQQLCTSIITLSKGEIINNSNNVFESTRKYLSNNIFESDNDCCWINDNNAYNHPNFQPLRLELVRKSEQFSDITVRITGKIGMVDSALQVGFGVYTVSGDLLFWAFHNDGEDSTWPKLKEGLCTFCCTIPYFFLNSGKYRLELLAALYRREWICAPGENAPDLMIEVKDFISHSSYWNVTRPGLLAPCFNWTAENGGV
ncbi:Vitamin B12 import ATP-binding protein BtuD [anaerobic digester metagenome]